MRQDTATIHNDAFKGYAVRIALTGGLTRREVAPDLGIGPSTPVTWARAVSEESRAAAHNDQKLLSKHGFKVSMSGKGNCHDNSAVERVFTLLKADMVWRPTWQTRQEAELALFDDLDRVSNPRRKHAAMGWTSPVAFDQRAAWQEHLTRTEPLQVRSARQ